MSDSRRKALEQLAERVHAYKIDHPLRVAVDGVTAAGKTTLANELAGCLLETGRPAVRLSMDGFHHPRAYRYRQGRDSARGYYEDAYDFAALGREVLVPLGPGGDCRYRRAVIDLATDRTIDDARIEIDPSAVLIVDGSFLQRSEIAPQWDFVIFVDTALAEARNRGVERDHAALGGRDKAALAFENRYHAACQMYLDDVNPAERADVVFDNNDLNRPIVRP